MADPVRALPSTERNGYGSFLMEEMERCSRCGGSGLLMVAEQPTNS